MTTPPAVVLLILDGWGDAPAWGGNAITSARLPTMSSLYQTAFHTTLLASGAAVGLPGHEQGNSEVGHLTIGAGHPIVQDRTKISNAIDDGSFFRNQVLMDAMDRVKESGTLHLVGLVSDGGVHSHIDHLHAILEMARDRGCSRVAIHAITDGRDTPPQSAGQFLDRVRHWSETLGVGTITSIVGRYYAMDRDNHWDRTKLAFDLLTKGTENRSVSALAAIGAAYSKGQTDEFIQPIWIEGGLGPIAPNDSLVFFNFRQDRARQLLTALADPAFTEFNKPVLPDLFVATMIPYWFDRQHPGVHTIFSPEVVKDSLGSVIAKAGLHQLRIAETEKFAHVTYFLNGGQEQPFSGEDRQLIASKLTQSAALAPAMRTADIAQAVVKAVKHRRYGCIIANIASPDMVGHTGDFKASVVACEVVDQAVAQILAATRATKTVLIITADHGNVEELINPVTNEPDTQHSTNPVPCIIDDPTGQFRMATIPNQTLSNVAPTVLKMLGLPVPHSMIGHPLVTMS